MLLKEAANTQERLPKLFIQWIRRYLVDAIPNMDQFLKLLRALKFSVNESCYIQSSQGRESLGQEIDAEVASELGDLPDQICCEVVVPE